MPTRRIDVLAPATLIACALLVVAGCTEPENPPPDDAWSVGCNGGQVQTGERGCLHACRDQSDCASDEDCRDVGARSKVCWPTGQPKDTGTDTATDSGRCDADEIETANKGCLTKCTDDGPCASNESCREVGLSSDVCWPEDPSDDEPCDADELNTVNKGCLTKCTDDTPCASDESCRDVGLSTDVCWPEETDVMCDAGEIETADWGCRATCTDDTPCTSDETCRDVGLSTDVCWPRMTGDTDPCDANEIDTANKGCLTKCTGEGQCPAGETCRDVGLSAGVCWTEMTSDAGM